MARLRNRVTGSEVVVPDGKVAGLQDRGFELVDAAPAKKAAAKKSSPSKSSK